MEYCHHGQTNTDDNLMLVTTVFAVLVTFTAAPLLGLLASLAIV